MRFPLSKVLSPEADEWGDQLLCPVCGFNCAHAGRPNVIRGGDYEAGWGGRGDLIVIPYAGECGHDFKVCFGFHKGENYCFVETEGAK